MLAALAVLAPAPLRASVVLPEKVAPGEKIVARMVVENVSARPMTLVAVTLPNGELGMGFQRVLTGPLGRILPDEIGPMMGQWMVGPEVPEGAFLTIRPGERREIYREGFSRRFLSKPPSLIAEYAKAPRAELDPGTYRYRMVYRLNPQVPTSPPTYGLRSADHKPKRFSPKASAAFHSLWRGEFAAEATFTVAAKP